MFGKIPKVSCSLLGAIARGYDLDETAKRLAQIGIDFIHYDIAEGVDLLATSKIPKLKKISGLPVDVHIALRDPSAILGEIQLDSKDMVAVHVESNFSLEKIRAFRARVGCAFGLAVNVETQLESLDKCLDDIDFVLFMSAEPGVTGGAFDQSVIDKVKKFRKQFPDKSVHMDGGVDRKSAALLRELGVDVMVSGSYIFNNEDNVAQVVHLLGRNLFLPMSKIMLSLDRAAIVEPNFSIRQVATEIERRKVGIALVLDEAKRLLGIITDGDLRRWLISDFGNVTMIASDIMTKNPLVVNQDDRLLDVLRRHESENVSAFLFPVLVGNRCVGLFRVSDVFLSNEL